MKPTLVVKPALVTILRDLAHGVGIWQAWCDFCEIAAITISNHVDLAHYAEREARYLAIIKRYTRPQLDAFAQAFAALVLQLEDGIDDVLGRAFMDLELGNKWAGQFFTPFSVCRMTAELQIDDDLRAKIADRGYVTMSDPAVGAAPSRSRWRQHCVTPTSTTSTRCTSPARTSTPRPSTWPTPNCRSATSPPC